jgi:hypothetical protein
MVRFGRYWNLRTKPLTCLGALTAEDVFNAGFAARGGMAWKTNPGVIIHVAYGLTHAMSLVDF